MQGSEQAVEKVLRRGIAAGAGSSQALGLRRNILILRLMSKVRLKSPLSHQPNEFVTQALIELVVSKAIIDELLTVLARKFRA